MQKYKIIKPGEAFNFTEKISVIQHRAGINESGVLDFETKKLFVIPRCGNTEAEDEPPLYGGRTRRNKPDQQDDYIDKIHRIKQVSVTFKTTLLPRSVTIIQNKQGIL